MIRAAIAPVTSNVLRGLLGSISEPPANLFSAGEVGCWGHINNITTLFQDNLGVTPITAAGQAVGMVKDKSGRGNHATQPTAASRPLYALTPSNGIRNLANGSASIDSATYWQTSTTVSGITVTRVASGIDTDGLPYNDWTVSGVALATAAINLYLRAQSRTGAAVGSVYTSSVIAQRIAGAAQPANCGVRAEVYGETAPSTANEAYNGNLVDSSSPTISTVTATLANAATNQVGGTASFRFDIGSVVNATYRVKALQLERASSRSAYQFNYTKTNIAESPFAQVGSLLFDGIDDFLVTPSIDFSGTDKVTVIVGLRKLSDAAQSIVIELTTGNPQRFGLFAPFSASESYRFVSFGSASSTVSASNSPAPDTAVLTGIGNIGGDVSTLRRNGVQVATSTADQGAGNFANAQVFIGRRGGTTLPFNGYIFGWAVRGADTPVSVISVNEGWMNAQEGAYQ